MTQQRIRKVILVTTLLLVAAAIAALAVRLGLRIPCVFHLITGLNCPGCGNTRAVMAMLRFDFREMLYYNLLFPLEMAYLVYLYVSSAIHYVRTGRATYKPKRQWPDVVLLIILLAWGVVRNVTPLY
jgi:hypothetical protein